MKFGLQCMYVYQHHVHVHVHVACDSEAPLHMLTEKHLYMKCASFAFNTSCHGCVYTGFVCTKCVMLERPSAVKVHS